MKTFLYVCSVMLALGAPLGAAAATVSINVQPTTVGVGDTLQATVLIDSDQPVNVFSGTLEYPPNLLVPVAVSDGNSIVSAWITHPAFGAGHIAFAGATPGGFAGRTGTLFSVLFKTAAAGRASLSLNQVQVLRDDGAGTSEPLALVPATLAITRDSHQTFTEPADTVPPEPFTVYRDRTDQLFNGAYYVAFAAVDKNSGIDHYELAETRFPLWLVAPEWTRVESPHLLTDQDLTSDVLIRAVDRAGNVRVAVSPRTHLLRPIEWGVLCGIVIAWVVFWYRRRYRSSKHS